MKLTTRRLINKAIAVTALTCMTAQPTLAAFINFAQTPLFIGANVPPQVMLTISKDQQLYKKAYNDYSDLDGDGQIETTYKHSIDYYGYFDPTKCYDYSTVNQRFEPASVSATKYCAGNWSGNFLNWVAMSRMDAVRKLLYGGLRSTDTSSATVLERSYLPTDAHSWAKYYNGTDIAQLTPFNPPTTTTSVAGTTNTQQFRTGCAPTLGAAENFQIPPKAQAACASTSSPVPPVQTVSTTTPSLDVNIPFNAAMNTTVIVGDQVRVESGSDASTYLVGVVLGFSNSNRTVQVRVNIAGVATPNGTVSGTSWRVINLSRTGISFCNTTVGAASGANSLSHTNTNPPRLRVAQGNFSLWNAHERYQCQWSEEVVRTNSNQGSLSEIAANAEYPTRATWGLGTGAAQGEYNVRVQACVTGLFGTERCKQYPAGNYKPIGLLQEYGDTDLIQFGLMTGTYRKNISGGVLRKNVGTFTNEVNVTTDGTFTSTAVPPGSPRATNAAATTPGIVNTLNYMRIWGYNYADGTYLGSAGDNCNFQLTNIIEDNCTSWGNPMSEVFFESLRYFAGQTATAAYTYTSSGSKDNQLGLPLATFTNPVTSANYCAPLNVLVFNASVSTNDDDLRTTAATAINTASTVEALTNAVGTAENITGSYFVGKIVGTGATATTDTGYELCTPKTIPGLGQVSGICPEGPTLGGSYLIAGLAHHARTNRIRADIAGIPATDTRSLKVTTYGIQLATNVPVITIPVPGSTTGQKVIIQPIYRLLISGSLGGGALVDLKFVRQQVVGNVATGKVYINWEDSEQGGDYDQDMWGTLEWRLDASVSPATIQITTNAIAESTNQQQGFGYTISGTTQDGPHFHSGIEGFNYTDPTGVLGCTNCQVLTAGTGQFGARSVTYTLGATSANTLKDPLWYAAKFGAFTDSNGNNVPDLPGEWDSKLATGVPGTDGIPDNYFLVSNPLGLEAALDRAFITILSNASASSVATNSTSLQTGSTIYQARFNANDWSGQVLAYAVDMSGQVSTNATWDAGQVINGQDFDSGRVVLTYNTDAAVRDGVAFRWPANPASPTSTEIPLPLVNSLNTTPSTSTNDGRGQQRLNYLRGDASQEGATVTAFRQRPTSKLGDIVNSNPNYVAAPNAGIGVASYAQFRLNFLNRDPMIYVGGNDGMLHGFRASDGRELLAYVPSKMHTQVNKLTSKTYTHQYYVDGSPQIGDAFIGTEWRTVLVSGLGAGGQSIFALDITDPAQFNETNAASTVMWEFSDTDDPDFGYVIGPPVIRKMANGRWAAIVSGGYNNSQALSGETACTNSTTKTPAGCTTSSTGSAYLYIIFLEGPTGTNRTWVEGTDYIKIRAQRGSDSTGTPNGLTEPLAADIDGDGVPDFIYAGDLRGRLWKFDVKSTTASAWTSSANQVVLYIAMDSLGNRQPITGKPEATLHPTSGYVISFGTGKYLEPSDPLAPYQAQTFYGIWDKNDGTTVSVQTTVSSKSQLLQQTITDVTVGTNTFRVVSANTPNWSTDTTPPDANDSPTKHMGWYMDFPNGLTTGERSVFRPILQSGRLIYTTLIPSTQVCLFGGTSFLMVLDPATGGRIDGAVLDTDASGTLTAADSVVIAGANTYLSGVQSKSGITPTPTIIRSTGGSSSSSGSASVILGTTQTSMATAGSQLAYAISAGSSGANSSTIVGLTAAGGRVSWRELLSD